MPSRFLLLLVLCGCGAGYDDTANLTAPGSTIVCFGDSITRGHGASQGRDYVSVLAQSLPGYEVVNAGRDGDTSGSALKRLEQDVLSLRPKVVVVELGGNDVLRRVPISETLGNMDAIVARCAQAGSIVVLVHARFGLFNDPFREGYEEIAERHGAVLIPNVLRGIFAQPKMMSDQIHPNDAGYALLAERIAEVLVPLLEASKAAA
jgi:acyl-CoA thioesterase-1